MDRTLIDSSYSEGVRDAVEYLAEVYGEGVYDTDVFDRLEVSPRG